MSNEFRWCYSEKQIFPFESLLWCIFTNTHTLLKSWFIMNNSKSMWYTIIRIRNKNMNVFYENLWCCFKYHLLFIIYKHINLQLYICKEIVIKIMLNFTVFYSVFLRNLETCLTFAKFAQFMSQTVKDVTLLFIW